MYILPNKSIITVTQYNQTKQLFEPSYYKKKNKPDKVWTLQVCDYDSLSSS